MIDSQTPVTVIGLGAMGTALTRALLAAGHPTTVWNRTSAKAAPLVSDGATAAATIEEAVAASPLIITCLTTFKATSAALEPAGAVLAERTLVTLNSGSPTGAREMADWAGGAGVRFLAGAVKNVPEAVGQPETLLYYSGDKAVFDEYVEVLRVLGGDTVHLGTEVDLAALYETAVGGMLLPALLGFFQGAALVTARGLPAATLVPYTVKWLEMISTALPGLAEEIDSGDYGKPSSSIGIFHEGITSDHEVGVEAGIDVSWHLPMRDLLRRAVDEGRHDESIAALVELLRNPALER